MSDETTIDVGSYFDESGKPRRKILPKNEASAALDSILDELLEDYEDK